jgi:pimeloyl-ACP methyl ester carboxylesterase
MLTDEIVERMQREQPRLPVDTWPDVGHNVPWEAPQALADLVLRFLKQP